MSPAQKTAEENGDFPIQEQPYGTRVTRQKVTLI